MGYRPLEQIVWFESLLIHIVSLLYAPQPQFFFFWLLLFLRLGPLARTLLCFQCFDLPLRLPTEKGWLAAHCMGQDWTRKYTLDFFCSLSFCGVSPLKLNVLHTLLNNRDYFLSGVGLFTSTRRFDLMLIQLNNTRVCQVHLFELYTWSLDKQVLTHSRCIIVILKLKLFINYVFSSKWHELL